MNDADDEHDNEPFSCLGPDDFGGIRKMARANNRPPQYNYEYDKQ